MKTTLIGKIRPKWSLEGSTLDIFKGEGLEISLRIHDNTGEYADIWLDFEDVLLLHDHLTEFIKSIK